CALPILVRPVDPGELPAEDDVVAVPDDAPRALVLARVGPGVEVGEPAEVGRVRLSLEAVVAALVRLPGGGADRLGAERDRPVVGVAADATGALAHPVDVLAVVGVVGDVDDVADRVDTVCVPVAVVEPVDLAVVPARREHALPGAAALAVG